jgi:hypothetical protein
MGDRSGIHSKKILIRIWPPTNIIPVTATLSSVNRAVAMCLHKIQAKKSRTQPANTPDSMNWFFRSLGIKFTGRGKKKQTGFQTVQDGKKVSIHEVHMYRIG